MELRGQLGAFLEELYSGVECEVRVSDVLSDPFEVMTGLRQGCVLSPLLFSLYINGVVEKLREAKVCIRCGVPALLFADDMVILTEGEEERRRGLGVLEEWCSEWAMKVNADKCGVMHIRRKGFVKRTTSIFSVGGEKLKVVESYEYLGCIVNEHMDCREMVRERATTGRGALSAWQWRCRVSVKEVRGKTFVKLMEALVESALKYGAEVWGSCKWLDCIEPVQLQVYRIFLGVGRLHLKTSLQVEMGCSL